MITLSQADAKQELKQYKDKIVESFERANDRFQQQDNSGITNRTQANIIRDYAVHYMRQFFKDDDNVRIIEKNNTVLFRFGDLIICRVKKLDKNFNASYNHTHESTNYCNQGDLFGGKFCLTNLHIGYRLNEFGIDFNDIIITCPINSGKTNRWKFSLTSALPIETTTTATLDFPEEGSEEQDERFRIKPELQKGQSKNDRTGTGGKRADTN